MDLLLDVNVVMDYCVPRVPWNGQVKHAVEHCTASGGRIWLYAGSCQTLVHRLANELRRIHQDMSDGESIDLAKRTLADFARDKHWLAALTEECNVFEAEDLEGEQLLRALNRFAPGTVAILTRTERLLHNNPTRTVSPDQFRQQSTPDSVVDFIDLKTQQDAIRPQLERYLHRVLHHGKYIMGPEVRELEETLAEYVGVTHCIGVSSGTDSLLIALMAAGVGAGDEVITTPFTFVATGEMIALLGAKPVFVDVDPWTYNIDPSLIEAAITSRTKAVMPVSLYGQCANFDAINAISKTHSLPVIEDAAQSFGATVNGRKSCALSTIGATSFFPSKPLGGYGDGGALFTNDDALAKAMREIRVHGQDRRYHHPRIGVNGRIDTIQAAVLLAKFQRFPNEVERRQQVGARYTKLINDGLVHSNGLRITPPYIAEGSTSVYAQYTIQVENRDAVAKRLNQGGVPSAIHYPVPLSLQPAFSAFGYRQGDFPVAEAASTRVMSLPMGPDLGQEEQTRISTAVIDAANSDVV